MAVIDPLQDAVVIRVVYDGPPLAGKTTSVRTLAKGLGGRVVAPEEIGGRTLFFDWLDYTGGLFEGRRIRCQIISVPGQATLASRRRRLIESADVVVFVGDSAPSEQSAAQSYLEGLRSVLDKVDGPPVGIVLQANKRDRPDAVPIDVVRAMLDRISVRIAVIESVAIDGSGIREAFVFAVRLALDRVRELMRTGNLRSVRPEVDSAQDLLAELQRAEGDALRLAADSGLVHTRLHEIRESSLAGAALEEAVRDNVLEVQQSSHASLWDSDNGQANIPIAQTSLAPTLTATSTAGNGSAMHVAPPLTLEKTDAPPLVPAGDLPSGRIWPPVNGRLILHRANIAQMPLKRHVNGDWVGTSEESWQMHSPGGARFADVDQGHEALVGWARMHAASANVISAERCVVLSKDGNGYYRLWQIVHVEKSLRRYFDDALCGDPIFIAKSLLVLIRAFLLAAERFSRAACWLPLTLRNIGALPSGSCFLGFMPDPQHARAAEPRSQDGAFRLLEMQLEYALPAIQAHQAQTKAALEQMMFIERDAPLNPAHEFARRFLDKANVSRA